MIVNVNLDKIKLEYSSIPLAFFDVLEKEGEIVDIKSKEGFSYHRFLMIQKKEYI